MGYPCSVYACFQHSFTDIHLDALKEDSTVLHRDSMYSVLSTTDGFFHAGRGSHIIRQHIVLQRNSYAL